MTTVPLESALVRGYLANDPEAVALVAFVAANADRPSSGSDPQQPMAASYVMPLAELETTADRTLLFEIEAVDPDTDECHSLRTSDESFWREMHKRLVDEEWARVVPTIHVVLDVAGAPRGYATHSPHIRAA